MRVFEWGFVAVVALVFAPALMALSGVYRQLDFYSHGYLVPLVALWAATAKRARLRATPRVRDARGLGVLALALLLYGVGALSFVVWLEGLGVVAAVAGCVLYLAGPQWLSILRFPIGYLLFMVPLPPALLSPAILHLQLFVSEVGVGLLRLGGVPVFRDGNVIELPGGESLFVAEACSGITSVVTLLPLGVLLAYFTERTLARRAVLVASVLPLAMIGNLVRVMATVLAARAYGVARATDPALHDSTGIATYVIGCLALLGVGALMRLLVPPEPATQ